MTRYRGERPRWHGSNWIRQEKRLALYLRDSFACVYCLDGPAEGATLTLDHLRPWSTGYGKNITTNLVTCCQRCNSRRSNMPASAYVRKVARVTGEKAADIQLHIRRCIESAIPLDKAKRLITKHGSAAKAVASL